jgi:hypothetical protein
MGFAIASRVWTLRDLGSVDVEAIHTSSEVVDPSQQIDLFVPVETMPCPSVEHIVYQHHGCGSSSAIPKSAGLT